METIKFDILLTSGEMVKAEPTVGMWYTGVELDEDNQPHYGEIVKYVGDGIFIDDDDQYGNESYTMLSYDYLVELYS